MNTLIAASYAFFILEIIGQAPSVDVESDSIEINNDHNPFIHTGLSALPFAVDAYRNSLDSGSLGFVYLVVRDSDADGDRLLKLGIISNTTVSPLPATSTTIASWPNPFRAECTASLFSSSQASNSATVVHSIVLHDTTKPGSSSQLLLLLCGRHLQAEVMEIRLLNSVTLDMLAILDVASASRVAFSLTSRGHIATKLHATEDRHNNGSGFEYFYGAVILSSYCEHTSSSSAVAAETTADTTAGTLKRSERPNCLVAIFAKATKLTNHQGSRSGSQAAANNANSNFDDSCKLLYWQPLIHDVVAGAVKTDGSKLSSSDNLPITLMPLPFRCILSAISTKGKLPRSRFSSSDGSLCNGFLAGPTYTGIPPTFDSTDATVASSIAASQRRCCNILLTLDNDEQLWSASTEPTTNFPGPMYPPGFQIMTRVEKYVEQEDDLDFVISSSSSSSEVNDGSTGVSELLKKQLPPVVKFINVGVARRFVKSTQEGQQRPSNKLPLRILSAAEREELMCMTSHQQPTTATLETAGKKRKRVAEETQQQSAAADTENTVAAVMEGPRGLSLLDVLPLPRRVYTGDFAQRMTRERQLGNALTDFCLNPSAVAERLMEFEKEAADNVRRAEINKERARRRQKAIKEEKNRQRLLLEQSHRAAASAAAAAAAQAIQTAAVAIILEPNTETSSSNFCKEGDIVTEIAEGEREEMQVVVVVVVAVQETMTDELALTVSE